LRAIIHAISGHRLRIRQLLGDHRYWSVSPGSVLAVRLMLSVRSSIHQCSRRDARLAPRCARSRCCALATPICSPTAADGSGYNVTELRHRGKCFAVCRTPLTPRERFFFGRTTIERISFSKGRWLQWTNPLALLAEERYDFAPRLPNLRNRVEAPVRPQQGRAFN